MEAELIDGLCQRWSCLPSAVLQENAAYVLRMLDLLSEDAPEPAGERVSKSPLLDLPMEAIGG